MQTQYEELWLQPRTAPVIWLALLFGILRIVVGAWIRDATEPAELRGKCSDLATLYRRCAADCLTHADYASPQEYLLEASLLHLYVEYSGSHDFCSSVWVQYGMVVRLSLRLGYHLDPQSLRDIRPFHREMRRRVWAYIRQADLLYSFQIGLPSMVHPRWMDGDLPHNIDDEDFGPHSDELPTPKPDSELTSASYMIAKAKLVFGFARAMAEVDQEGNVAYTRVLKFDSELRSIYQSIPAQYQVHDLAITDDQDPILTGLPLVLGAIYHKALCVIHSKYLKETTTDQQYLYSWLICINSAMTVLSYQSFLHQHLRVDSQWARLIRYQHSTTRHDVFLAATILCTALFLIKDSSTTTRQILASVGPSEEEIFAALERSLAIFVQDRSTSREASRASECLAALLGELRPSLLKSAESSMLHVRTSNGTSQSTKNTTTTSTHCTGADESLRSSDTYDSISQRTSADDTLQPIPQPLVSRTA